MDFLRIISGLTLIKVSVYIANNYSFTGYDKLYEDYPSLFKAVSTLNPEQVKELNETEHIVKTQYQELLQIMTGDFKQAPAYLHHTCQNVLDLCLTQMMYPEFGSFLTKYMKCQVTLKLAFGLEECPEPSFQDYSLVTEGIERIFLFNTRVYPFFLKNIEADNRLFSFLFKNTGIQQNLSSFTTLYIGDESLQNMFINEHLLPEILYISELNNMELIHLSGSYGSGRTLLLKHFCKQTKAHMLIIDFEKMTFNKELNLDELLFFLRREFLFDQSVFLCFHGVSDELLKINNLSVETFITQYISPLLSNGIPVCICTDPSTPVACHTQAVCCKIEIPECTMQQRIVLWKGYSSQYGIPDGLLDYEHYGTKYKLSPLEIQKVVLKLSYYVQKSMNISDALISSICNDIIPPPSTGKLQRIKTDYTLDDLILPAREKEQLQALCSHIWYSSTVFDSWNLNSKFSYGKGFSALFTGPPGTGKTMAAHAIANALNLPLFKADLSQIADKYIGESEKHLEEIFSATEKSNTILFFDEADSLFGKRSDVNDSKDKYANNEVSYILQRIERYDGIVLLATNFQNNIDTAFLRRMRYVIQFPLPDKENRLKIWKSCLIPELPTVDLNLEYLAENFTLTGSNIKNVILAAAFQAASEGSSINMKHILIAIRSECSKSGKKVLASDLGFYADLLDNIP